MIRPLLAFLVAATAHAAELTLEKKPFFISHSFPATAIPAESSPIRLDPKSWATFKILTIATHGARVKKGENLITFETEDIDKKLASARQSIAKETLQLADATLALSTLEADVPEQLKRLQRDADEATEKLTYFTATSRKITEQSADMSLAQNQKILESQQEELKQLLQMYQADDITEDTEEIILDKQKFSVEMAQFGVKRSEADHKRTKEITIPRQLITLTEAKSDAKIALDTASEDLPRSIDLKKIEVETLKTSLEQSNQSLTELVADRTLFAIKAPADGTFYLGFIEQGKWVTGELVKSLVPLAAAPTGRTIATFIPATTTLVIQAFLDQANALSLALAPGATGSATLNGRAELPLSVTLKSIATTPDPEKTFPATFITKWPDGLIPAAGHALQVNVVSYSAESAIAVPNTALSFGPKGWVAEVKLADGKTEKRPVSLGRTSGDKTEIIGGLEAGQVIITP